MSVSLLLRHLSRSPRAYHQCRNALKTFTQLTVPQGIPPPLDGIKILDLTRVLAGPTATMLLADLGADVIKVEEVSRGDDTRWVLCQLLFCHLLISKWSGSWSPPSAPLSDNADTSHLPPESAYFLAINRNKRSITVNFKDPRGLEILKKLVQESDVLVENFISGKLASMGLGWEVHFLPSSHSWYKLSKHIGLREDKPSYHLYVYNRFVASHIYELSNNI